MDTAAFDRMTETFARQDEADAFLVKSLGRERHGAAWLEPTFVRDFFAARTSIVRPSVAHLATKSAIAALDTSSGLAPSSPEERAFLAQVQRVGPVGQIGGITVNGTVTGSVQTGNATATWAGEQTSKPISALSFTSAPLRPLKLISQVIVSKELADLSVPDALNIVRRALVSAAAAAEATKLLSTDAASAGISPAGLLNGVSTITPAGDFANNVGQVLGALSGGSDSRGTRRLVPDGHTHAGNAAGSARDRRVVISSAAGSKIIGIDADGLLVSEGGIEIRRGTPDVQMSDTPDSPPTASTVLVSTWQRNLVALKVERWIDWTARTGAVATLTLA